MGPAEQEAEDKVYREAFGRHARHLQLLRTALEEADFSRPEAFNLVRDYWSKNLPELELKMVRA